jgi:hypothetical protein
MKKMDGIIGFQADGAAHHQARSQAAAGDIRKTRSRDIEKSIAHLDFQVKQFEVRCSRFLSEGIVIRTKAAGVP